MNQQQTEADVAGLLPQPSQEGNVLASPHERLVNLALSFRKRRLQLFESLIARLPRPLRILDVGGTPLFWRSTGFRTDDLVITLYNLERFDVPASNMTSIVGDARDMHLFEDQSFDIVFSNSVMDHLGSYEHQSRMAEEVQRVGKRYFVQIPNRHFPIEPHFIVPFFQFLPLNMRIFLAMHINGWGRPYVFRDEQEARQFVSGIRLVTEKELRSLFPGAAIYKERFLGLTKSFIAYQGF